jgi:hypothetical protein
MIVDDPTVKEQSLPPCLFCSNHSLSIPVSLKLRMLSFHTSATRVIIIEHATVLVTIIV